MSSFKAWWKGVNVNSLDIVAENKSLSGYHLGYLINNPVVHKDLYQDLTNLIKLWEQGLLKIKIDSTFSFSKAGEAMKRLNSRQNIGKIILKPDIEFVMPATSDQVKIITTVISTTTTPSNISTQVETSTQQQQVPGTVLPLIDSPDTQNQTINESTTDINVPTRDSGSTSDLSSTEPPSPESQTIPEQEDTNSENQG
jgi:hypothetical protein